MVLLSLIVAVISIGCRAIADTGSQADDYRSWTRLTSDPHPVSFALSAQCAPVTAAQLERDRQIHGPHSDRWIMVYANPIAAAALRDKNVTVFPEGAVIVKEKLRAPEDPKAEAVAVMTKRSAKDFPNSNGWEFSFRPTEATPTYEGCIACHRAGGKKDFVFGQYGG
jgi:hypothetical protein